MRARVVNGLSIAFEAFQAINEDRKAIGRHQRFHAYTELLDKLGVARTAKE
jgi:hypothetical protein